MERPEKGMSKKWNEQELDWAENERRNKLN